MFNSVILCVSAHPLLVYVFQVMLFLIDFLFDIFGRFAMSEKISFSSNPGLVISF